MDEDSIRRSSDILAIKQLLVDLYVNHLGKCPDPAEAAAVWHDYIAKQADNATMPRFDPAESDVRSAAFRDALLKIADVILERVLEQAKRSE